MNEPQRKDFYHLTAVGECLDATLSRMLFNGEIEGDAVDEIQVSF